MSVKISNLIRDIYSRITTAAPVLSQNVEAFGKNLAQIMSDRLNETSGQNYLRPSNLSQPCERKLWYTINSPDDAEPLGPKAKLKFLYGDIIEALILFLSAEAGHEVEGCQDQVEISGVKGRRDAIIDGHLVDVKSANSRSFRKFSDGLTDDTDGFGYRGQLRFYLKASENDPKVRVKDKAAFLAVDKELGGLALDWHDQDDTDWEALIASKRAMLDASSPPDRAFEDVPEGKSGNMKLPFQCAYCPFKKKCWPDLRTFLYARGPVYLTTVVTEPKVAEITDGTAV